MSSKEFLLSGPEGYDGPSPVRSSHQAYYDSAPPFFPVEDTPKKKLKTSRQKATPAKLAQRKKTPKK